MNGIVNHFKKMTFKQYFWYGLIGICFVASILFVTHNDSFYKRSIAKVTKTHLQDSTKVSARNNEDHIYTQSITAEIKNGKHKGEPIHLTNKYSASGAYDQAYHAGNQRVCFD